MTAQSANDLSSVFNTVRERVSRFANERRQLADNLRQIISSARDLLVELGEAVETGRRRGRPAAAGAGATRRRRRRGPGRPKGSAGKKGAGKRGRPKRRTMSADARRRISEAQKARWARQRAGKGK
ncbi:MAG TPA: hypothetical protein VFK57_17900 [Vicinamibacterales bacterium]|nr:hypothetical protein [Vicinamibacterales bacterium]